MMFLHGVINSLIYFKFSYYNSYKAIEALVIFKLLSLYRLLVISDKVREYLVCVVSSFVLNISNCLQHPFVNIVNDNN